MNSGHRRVLVSKGVHEYAADCDFCGVTYYHPTRINKKKNGRPVYQACDHCLMYSTPGKLRPYTRHLAGRPWKTPVSGSTFSMQWMKNWIKPTDPKDSEGEDGDEARFDPPSQHIVPESLTEAAETAVGAVQGLVKGAADALGSLTKIL